MKSGGKSSMEGGRKKSGESGIGDVGKGLGASCYLNCVVRMGFID